MQLHQILLTLLMNQVQTEVEEEGEHMVPNEHALQVQSQKNKLQEISKNLKATGDTSSGDGHRVSEWSKISEREIHIGEASITSPPRQMPVPQISSLPKKPGQAAPAGASGVRSRPTEAPMTGGSILAHPGVLAEETTVTEGEFKAPHGRDLCWTQEG